MPSTLSITMATTLLLLLVCSNHAMNLRGRATPDSDLQQAAKQFGANQAFNTFAQQASLRSRIIESVQNLNHQMASILQKGNQLQRYNTQEQIDYVKTQNNRFRDAPLVGPIQTPSVSILHPVLPMAQQTNQPPNATNPLAWLSFNTLSGTNIPLPQQHVTSFMGPHSLGFPLQQGNSIRGVGLPGPSLYPAVAHVPSYPVSMVGSPYFDPRGYPSSILNVPNAEGSGSGAQASGFMVPYPVAVNMPPMTNTWASPYARASLVGLAPHPFVGSALPSPVVGYHATPAFIGGYHTLPVDAMGYPLPFPGSSSMIPPPKGGSSTGSGSG